MKKTLAATFKELEIIAGPHYVSANPVQAGGCKSTVTLGPGAVNLAMGTDADPNLPAGIRSIRKKYPQYSFKAGHILNAEFGGDGKDARNLTALTASANGANRSFDQRVKDALVALGRFYEHVHANGTSLERLEFGITVTVETTGAYWGTTAPEAYITTGLICRAELYGTPDLDEFLTQDSHKARAGKIINDVIAFVAAANAAGHVANSR